MRIEDFHDGPLRGYGEHPILLRALYYASEDYLAGGRPYDEVYGKLKPHHLHGKKEAQEAEATSMHGSTSGINFGQKKQIEK